MAAVARYEGELFARLDGGRCGRCRTCRCSARPVRSTPTVAFTRAADAARGRWRRSSRGTGICAWDGDYYARELFDAIGVNESGGAVRLGLLHYNTAEEVDRLIDAVAALDRPALSRRLNRSLVSPVLGSGWQRATRVVGRAGYWVAE